MHSAFVTPQNEESPKGFFSQSYFRNNKGVRQGGKVTQKEGVCDLVETT
jgi:hypothetical protein